MQITERWDYFKPNWQWSRDFLDSENRIAKIGRATVIPFLFITTFEALCNTLLFAANVPILVANKIHAKIPPFLFDYIEQFTPKHHHKPSDL